MKEEKIIKEITQIATRLQHMHYDINEVKMIVKEQNGRVRKNEVAISWIKGIGSTITFILGSVLAWFKIGDA